MKYWRLSDNDERSRSKKTCGHKWTKERKIEATPRETKDGRNESDKVLLGTACLRSNAWVVAGCL